MYFFIFLRFNKLPIKITPKLEIFYMIFMLQFTTLFNILPAYICYVINVQNYPCLENNYLVSFIIVKYNIKE